MSVRLAIQIPFSSPSQTAMSADTAPQDRKLRHEAARIIAPTINGGASCFSSSALAPVYHVSDLHRSPISGLCSKYT